MPWDRTPWFIGNGTEHSPETARLLGYAATAGNEGVISPNDLRVVATDIPSNKLNVLPGAAVMLNRNVAADGGQQSYIERLPVFDQITPTPTTGVGARTDLIIVRVEDPQYEGTPVPANKDTAQYVFTRIIEGVSPSVRHVRDLPANLRKLPSLALALLSIPANTNVYTNDMLLSLREVAQPKRDQIQAVSTGLGTGQTQDLTATSFARWITPAAFPTRIPLWATHYSVRLDVLNGIHVGGNVTGSLGVYLNNQLAASNPYACVGVPNQGDGSAGSERVPILSAVSNGRIQLASTSPGQTFDFDLRALRETGTGFLRADAQTRVVLEVTFYQQAI